MTTTQTCPGEVERVSHGGQQAVRYEIDGQIYIAEVECANAGFSVGDAITVYYNETNPEECRVLEMEDAESQLYGAVFTYLFQLLFPITVIPGVISLITGILLIRSLLEKNKGMRQKTQDQEE